MTDITKYSNASLTIETMKLLKKQSKTICLTPLSISKTIEHCAKFYEKHKDFIQYQKGFMQHQAGEAEMKKPSIDFRGRPVHQGRPVLLKD